MWRNYKMKQKELKYDQNNYYVYDKTPIILSHSSVAVIEIYRKQNIKLDDHSAVKRHSLQTNAIDNFEEEMKKSAEKLIKSLEGEQCDLFMMALFKETARYLKEQDLINDRIGTENERFAEVVEKLLSDFKLEYLEKLE